MNNDPIKSDDLASSSDIVNDTSYGVVGNCASNPTPIVREHEKRPLGLILLIVAAISYYFLARFGISLFALKPDNITLLWLPSGIALIMCLQWEWKALPLIFIASFLANVDGMGGLGSGRAIMHTSVSAFVDMSAGMIAAFIFRRSMPLGLHTTRDLFPFVALVCITTTMITSTAIALNLVLGKYIHIDESGDLIRMLVMADSLGILLVYPVYQGWLNGISFSERYFDWFFGGLGAILLTFTLAWSEYPSAMFFALAILLLVSFNSDLFGTCMLAAVTFTFIAFLTAMERGPLITTTVTETNIRLVSFLFSGSLIVLGTALQNRKLELTQTLKETWQNAAKTDALTGLFNRRAFFSKYQHELYAHADLNGEDYSVALLDLDNFKKVNDRYGHEAGDTVLKHFSRLLQEHCRDIDTPARLGGEEFALFMPECGLGDAIKIMNGLRTSFEEQPVKLDDNTIYATVSIGISSRRSIKTDQDNNSRHNTILGRADKALYEAKSSGRNCVMVA